MKAIATVSLPTHHEMVKNLKKGECLVAYLMPVEKPDMPMMDKSSTVPLTTQFNVEGLKAMAPAAWKKLGGSAPAPAKKGNALEYAKSKNTGKMAAEEAY